MVLLRRAQQGCLHTFTRWFYMLLNVLIIVAGILMISMVFVLQKHPKSPGLAIVFLGFETIAAGIAGMKEQVRVCCILYGVLCSIAAFGSAVLCLFIFSNEPKVVEEFKSSWFGAEMLTKLIWSIGWAFLFLFVIEALGMFLAFLLHCCSPLESYETLDETRQHRAFGFFNLRRDMGIASDKANTRQAKYLATKMNKKYGKYGSTHRVTYYNFFLKSQQPLL